VAWGVLSVDCQIGASALRESRDSVEPFGDAAPRPEQEAMFGDTIIGAHAE